MGAASALAFPHALRAKAGARREKPNLIVFLPDQQRADTIAAYGGTRVHAPNLNKLASQSVVFDRAYVTHPVCTPSRSALLTGTWPHQNGCANNNTGLGAETKCLPELVADADYRTGYMGKWHLGDEVFAQHGFEEWVSIEDLYQKYFSPGRDRSTISDYSRFLASRGLKPDKEDGSFSRKFASRQPLGLSKTVFLAQHACSFLERHRHEPFILFVSFLEPHTPFYGPFNREHPLEEVELDRSSDHVFGQELPLRYRLRQEFMEEAYGKTPAEYRQVKQRYLGLVTQIDRSIGAILGKLDQLGLTDNTIVAHTSDHGEMMGAHRLFLKQVMFEEAVRVPYLVRMPGQNRQLRVEQPVSHIDFASTLLELLKKPEHPQCVGRSHASLLHGVRQPAQPVFIEWSPDGGDENKIKEGTTLASPEEIRRAIGESTRTVVSPDGWKLCLRDTGENELYNRRADPEERHNFNALPASQETQDRLRALILQWQEKTADKVVLS